MYVSRLWIYSVLEYAARNDVLRQKDYWFHKSGFAIIWLAGTEIKGRFICTTMHLTWQYKWHEGLGIYLPLPILVDKERSS